MPRKPKRIHVNKGDAWIVLALIVLVSTMTFTVGMLMGFGFGEIRGVKAYIEELERDKLADVKESESDGKNLAMVKAMSRSKQGTLNELLSQQSREAVPKSVADTRAYFKKFDSREGEQSDVARQPAQESSESKEVARIPAAVKRLFEPKATDPNLFKPVPEQWTIQVASYPTKEQAYAKMLTLKENRVNDSYIKDQISDDGALWHSVFVGSYKDQAWTKRMAQRLKRRKLIVDYQVKKVP